MVAGEVSEMDIREYIITPNSSWKNKAIQDLDFTDRVNINAVVRDNQLLMPEGSLVLEKNDIVYILASKDTHQYIKSYMAKNIQQAPKNV